MHDAVGDRQSGPIRLNTRGRRLSPASATAHLHRLARAIGIDHPVSPHSLRRTFCTAGLISGVPLRDMQYAMRHADTRTTMRWAATGWAACRSRLARAMSYLAGMAMD